MDHPDRAAQVSAFMSTMKWMLGVLMAIAVISFVVALGAITDSRKQTLDALADMRKQLDSLKDQTVWNKQDQQALRETVGELRARLKRGGVQE